MSSSVHYRFKAGSSEWSRLQFEGHTISLGEARRLITQAKKLSPLEQQAAAGTSDTNARDAGQGRTLQDFELVITNIDTNEEYRGEATPIPKNSSLIIRRVPTHRGKTLRLDADGVLGGLLGSALSGAGPDESPLKRTKFEGGALDDLRNRQIFGARAGGIGGADEFGEDPLDEASYIQREEERRAKEMKERQAAQQAMLDAQQKARMENAAAMAAIMAVQARSLPAGTNQAVTVQSGVLAGATAYVRPPPSRPPPPGYTCHNCKLPGHWKQSCPTASHLSGPKEVQVLRGGREVTLAIGQFRAATGGNVVLPTGIQAVLSAYASKAAGGAYAAPARPAAPALPPVTSPPDLTCTLCHLLFTNPMVVPCCFTSFCEECIKQALVAADAKCPRCENDSISADQLRPNNVMARRVETERKRVAEITMQRAAAAAAAAPAHSSAPYQQNGQAPFMQQQQYAAAAAAASKRKITSFDGDEDYNVRR